MKRTYLYLCGAIIITLVILSVPACGGSAEPEVQKTTAPVDCGGGIKCA